MSPVRHVRTSVFYVMLVTQIILSIVAVVLIIAVWDTRDDVSGTRNNLAIGCDRANRTRAASHWNTIQNIREAANRGDIAEVDAGEDVLAGLNLTPREFPRRDKPWLVDCEAAYP